MDLIVEFDNRCCNFEEETGSEIYDDGKKAVSMGLLNRATR